MPEQPRPGKITVIENAQLMYKNFTGDPDKYNPQGGRRNFAVVIEPENVPLMRQMGWNIRENQPRVQNADGEWVVDPDGEIRYTLKINVGFTGFRPPDIYLITSKGKRQICKRKANGHVNPSEIDVVQWAHIVSTDVSFRPYEYEPGKFSAWLTSLYVTIEQDFLSDKYSEVKDLDDEDFVMAGTGEEPF